MPLIDNERTQEILLVVGDKLAPVQRKWWLALGLSIVAAIPLFILLKLVFVQILVRNFDLPQIVYTAAVKEPLQVTERKILKLPNNTYSGYVRIKNINLEWGIANQPYTVSMKTLGGTLVQQYNSSTFILPSSEKIIVIPRFTSQQEPNSLEISLAEVNFTRKPGIDVSLEVERVNLQNPQESMTVNAGVKNLTPFIIKRVDLPVVVYNDKNEVVAVNSTYINDLVAAETRTFQYTWPSGIDGAIRAEINPEINIFDRNILQTPAGVSPF